MKDAVYQVITDRVIALLQQGTIPGVQSWLNVLKGDVKLVVQAAAQAQKASDFILGVTFGAENQPAVESAEAIN